MIFPPSVSNVNWTVLTPVIYIPLASHPKWSGRGDGIIGPQKSSLNPDILEYLFLAQEEYLIDLFDWLHLKYTIYSHVFVDITGGEEADTSFF